MLVFFEKIKSGKKSHWNVLSVFFLNNVLQNPRKRNTQWPLQCCTVFCVTVQYFVAKLSVINILIIQQSFRISYLFFLSKKNCILYVGLANAICGWKWGPGRPGVAWGRHRISVPTWPLTLSNIINILAVIYCRMSSKYRSSEGDWTCLDPRLIATS